MSNAGGRAAVKKAGRPKSPSAKAPSQRQLRVGEEIRHVLAGIFGRGELRDPSLADVVVTVTEVRIGPDLRRATAFVTRLGRSDIDQALPALRLGLFGEWSTQRQTPVALDLMASYVTDCAAVHVIYSPLYGGLNAKGNLLAF